MSAAREIAADTPPGGGSPKPTLTDVAKRFSVSPTGAGFKITRTKDSEYTVSRLLGPGGGAGAPRNLYVGDLNGIVTSTWATMSLMTS